MRINPLFRQQGQGMVEFTIILIFCIMIMTIGPGGDILLDMLGVMNDKQQGYSYATSMSDLPQYDNNAAYVIANPNGVNASVLANQINNFTSFPQITTPPTSLIPTSPNAFLQGSSTP